MISENILGRLTVFQSSFLLFVTFDHSLLKWNGWGTLCYRFLLALLDLTPRGAGWGGGALGYLLGGYVPHGTLNWHPVLKKISPKIDTPF